MTLYPITLTDALRATAIAQGWIRVKRPMTATERSRRRRANNLARGFVVSIKRRRRRDYVPRGSLTPDERIYRRRSRNMLWIRNHRAKHKKHLKWQRDCMARLRAQRKAENL